MDPYPSMTQDTATGVWLDFLDPEDYWWNDKYHTCVCSVIIAWNILP